MGQAAAHADGDHDPAQRRRPGPCIGPGSGGKVQGEIEPPGSGKADVASSTHVKKRRSENDTTQVHLLGRQSPGGAKCSEGCRPPGRPVGGRVPPHSRGESPQESGEIDPAPDEARARHRALTAPATKGEPAARGEGRRPTHPAGERPSGPRIERRLEARELHVAERHPTRERTKAPAEKAATGPPTEGAAEEFGLERRNEEATTLERRTQPKMRDGHPIEGESAETRHERKTHPRRRGIVRDGARTARRHGRRRSGGSPTRGRGTGGGGMTGPAETQTRAFGLKTPAPPPRTAHRRETSLKPRPTAAPRPSERERCGPDP